jgi:hypothetical protein
LSLTFVALYNDFSRLLSWMKQYEKNSY